MATDVAVAVTIGRPHGICDHINVVVVIRGLRRAWGSVLKTAGLSLVVHVVDGLRIEDRYVVTSEVKAVKKAHRKIGLTPDRIHSPSRSSYHTFRAARSQAIACRAVLSENLSQEKLG